ncbi:MAG: hypothetical protein JWO38_7143, partial [Gemmataceae bacterium]|nr:hypothetical protein [Gemmataceae bacterium]
PDDHRLPDPRAGRLLEWVSQVEILGPLDDALFLGDLDLPDAAWEDPAGWDGWTAGSVREVLAAFGDETGQDPADILAAAGRQLERETAGLRGKVARLEAGLARAEADLGGAVELARQVNLVPTHSTDKVMRYEAHLSRQLTQTFQLFDRLQAARAGGRFRPPAAGEWESGCVPPAGSEAVSADRTQFAAERPPEVSAEPVPPVGQAVVSAERTQSAPEVPPALVVEQVPPVVQAVGSAERTQSGPTGSPVAAAGRRPSAVQAVGSAERTQLADRSPSVVASGALTGSPGGSSNG